MIGSYITSNNPCRKQSMDTIIGIDLGTTNSEVAIVRDGQTVVLREDGEAILPSVVGLDAEGQLIVGTPARNQWVLAPERTVRSIKRKMGEEATVRLGKRDYAPQEISAIILRRLKERAERELGHPVRKAVITVPAFFNEIQREATREAGELAGLEVMRILNEPTAAALTYDPHPDRMERLLVYDLGGGTFDVSIVQIEQGVVEVLSSHGDTHLGGDDFDQLLLDDVCKRFNDEHGIDLRKSLVAKSRVLRAVEEAKKQLSFEPAARIQEEFIAEKKGVPLHLDVEILRDEYEDLIEPWIAKTLTCVDEALSDAKLHVGQIDKVVLVGGSSRTPMVHRLLQERLGQEAHAEVDPDLCVAMGAAIQAAMIAGIDVGPVLVDITPHTLGTQAIGMMHGFECHHCFVPIIERNTPLPATRSEIFQTVVDQQKKVRVTVFQGENRDVRHNELVGEFMLEGLAEVRRGNEILVRFDLDLDGILKVAARERATGLEERLTIDNAVSRFRMKNRDVAPSPELTPVGAGAPAGEMAVAASTAGSTAQIESPEWTEKARQSESLVAKARKIAPQAPAEDQKEIERLIDDVGRQLASQSADELAGTLAELEDLLFYLEGA
jgi:molecular chaperone DnaK